MDQLHQENPNTISVIAWHVGDVFELPEGIVRDDWYAIEGYPTVWFDGWENVLGGYTPTSYPYYVPVYEERIGIPSNFSIEMEITNTDATEYNVDATVEVLEGVNTENLAFFVVLTETDLESSGDENQNFVARNVYPDAMGLPVDFSVQTIQTFNTVITLEDEYVFENCEVIVFIQNMDTKEIYQGTSLMMTDITIGLDEPHQLSKVEVYPNPTSDVVNIHAGNEIKKVSVYNNNGQLVFEKTASTKHYHLSTSGFETGLYLFRIETMSGIITSKVNVVK